MFHVIWFYQCEIRNYNNNNNNDQVMPWIHVKDVAGLMVHAVQTDSISGIYNAVAPEHVTNTSYYYHFYDITTINIGIIIDKLSRKMSMVEI